MCYSRQIGKSKAQLSARFKASFVNPDWHTPGDFTAFTFPVTPVITHAQPELIQGFSWGLLPPRAEKDWLQGGELLMQNDRLRAEEI